MITLFTPGPTPTPNFINKKMMDRTIHHRTKEFQGIFEKAKKALKDIMHLDEVVMFASSGSGAMEASVINLCNKKALCVVNGKFGERFTEICAKYNIPYKEISYIWDTPANIDDIANALKQDKDIDAVFMQITESSGGIRNDIDNISKAIKNIREDIMVVCDGITSIGVQDVNTKYIDALIGGSQKAFMLPPGLSFIGLSQEAISRASQINRGYYFNIINELKSQKDNKTAFTPATIHIIGIVAFYEEVQKKGGLKVLYKETKARAYASRAALKAIGCTIFPKFPSNALSAIKDDRSEELRAIIRDDFGIDIALGQSEYKKHIYRISHMGLISPQDMLWVVNAVELAKEKMNVRKYDTTASSVFLNEYYKVMKEDA